MCKNKIIGICSVLTVGLIMIGAAVSFGYGIVVAVNDKECKTDLWIHITSLGALGTSFSPFLVSSRDLHILNFLKRHFRAFQFSYFFIHGIVRQG